TFDAGDLHCVPRSMNTTLNAVSASMITRVRSERPIAFDRDPAAGPRLRVIIPECLVLDAAVVPKGDRRGLPAEPHLEFLPGAELAQKVQARAALLSRQPIDMGGELAIDVQRLALCHRMGANNRMRCFRVDLTAFGDTHQRVVPTIDVVARMSRRQ